MVGAKRRVEIRQVTDPSLGFLRVAMSTYGGAESCGRRPSVRPEMLKSVVPPPLRSCKRRINSSLLAADGLGASDHVPRFQI